MHFENINRPSTSILNQNNSIGGSTNFIKFFPIAALPPNLQCLVKEIHCETDAPIPSIVSALLVALSLICQGRIKVRKRRSLVSPVSLWFIVVLGSGERKTSVMNIVLRAIEDFINEDALSFKQKMEEYSNQLAAWKAESKGILAAIRKKSAKNEGAEEEKQRLDELNDRKPQKPKQFKLLHEKCTPLAIVKNLKESFPTTGLISDEAACVFSGRGMSDMGLLNRGWDGSPMSVERASEESLYVRAPALTMALYVQREVAEAFFDGKGALARSIGLLARCYYVTPDATAGTRFLAHKREASLEVLNEYYDRCRKILRAHITDNGQDLSEKIELHFSPEAQSRWEREHDAIESMMNPGGFFFNDKDFASKHADKIARLAALLHFFGQEDGPISIESLERSIAISGWFAEEFVRNFAKPPQVPQEQINANLLLPWLADYIRTTGLYVIKRTDVLHDGPRPVRSKYPLIAALIVLWQQGIVREVKYPNDKTTYLELNANYFTPYLIHRLCTQGVVNS